MKCFLLSVWLCTCDKHLCTASFVFPPSKHILAFSGGSPPDPNEPTAPSHRTFKLCRGVRVYASTYLQNNLLLLPSLPSVEKLAEIRQRREREARERQQEFERERERQREREAGSGPAHAVQRMSEVEVGEEEDEREEWDVVEEAMATERRAEKKKRFEKLKNFSSKVTSKVHFRRQAGGGVAEGEGVVTVQRMNSGSGWMGDALDVGSVDSNEDPFTLQYQQLLIFIKQARQAGRMDEVAALEESMRDIEQQMSQQQNSDPNSLLSYGFD